MVEAWPGKGHSLGTLGFAGLSLEGSDGWVPLSLVPPMQMVFEAFAAPEICGFLTFLTW